jgi:hypothetical protein
MRKPWHLRMWAPLAAILLLIASLAHAQIKGSSTQTAVGVGCNSAAVYDASTNGSTQLVPAGLNGEAIYICGYTIFGGGTANVELDYGTGTACATGNKKIVPAYAITTGISVTDDSPFFRGIYAPSGTALCIKTSAGVPIQALVFYAQF